MDGEERGTYVRADEVDATVGFEPLLDQKEMRGEFLGHKLLSHLLLLLRIFLEE